MNEITTPVFTVMNYLGNLEPLRTVYNNHFSLSSGDLKFWSNYATSPIFPVSEQPEAEDYYILYNYLERVAPGSWWHLDTTLYLYVASNSLVVIERSIAQIRAALGDYEFAAERVNQFAAANGLDGPPVNYIGFQQGSEVASQEQENGVMIKEIRLRINSTVC